MADRFDPSKPEQAGRAHDPLLALVMAALHLFGFVMAGTGLSQILNGSESGERLVLIGFTAAIVAYVLAICEQEQRRPS